MGESIEAINFFCHQQPVLLCSLLFILGCCVGSFLNVLALRSLKEESIVFPSSYCPQCQHKLSPLDNIPIISYLLLKGKCRYCKKPIHWQYPLVEFATGLIYAGIAYVFLVCQIQVSDNFMSGAVNQTSDLFQAIKDAKNSYLSVPQTLDSPHLAFYKYGLALGFLAFASTLVAVTITDFREKLIPHEITYPSMLFGIAFSAIVRGDFLGTMAGIGASYIIFDFLAFYGLKVYMMTHKNLFEQAEATQDEEDREPDQELDRVFDIRPAEEEEPIEVMGGGDAVLSAVMSAYLGWQSLCLSLAIGFIAGTAMGLALLVKEMKNAGLLKECGKKALIFALIGGLAMGLIAYPVMSLAALAKENLITSVISIAATGAMGGALMGLVSVGTRVSKPFPFGPALALGGFIAMFLIPYWLPFYFQLK